MDLATGEIFENPRYAKFRKGTGTQISAVLEIHESTEEPARKSGFMQYWEGISTPDGAVDSGPSINFVVILPANDFAELVTNLRHSLLPTSVVVDLEIAILGKVGPLKFGFEPDGSGTKWDNTSEGGKHVKIETVSFRYELLKEATDDETGALMDEAPPTVPESIKAEVKALNAQLAAIRTDLRYAGFAAFFVVAILIFRGFHF